MIGAALLIQSGLGSDEVGLIGIDGAIGPATADYIDRSIGLSIETDQECLVITLDTPGGLLESTQEIVKLFYASSVPIVVYVAPTGANAGSAGCFITLAADVAAMAPNTSIGAAHPVALSGGSGEQVDDMMKQKIENFAASYIEAIAERRGRNAEWARSAVRESASVTSEEALEIGVIDLIAVDLTDLLKKIDGLEVEGRTLHTIDKKVSEIPMLFRERVFQMIWRPEVMFILLLIAVYGILGELSNPGAIIPGVIGLISLILVLYMAAVLPVNIAGLALMALAVGLFVAEAFTPTFGLLTTGGIAAFAIGAMMLFDTMAPAFRLSLGMVIPASVITALFVVFVVGAGLRAQRLPVRAGTETLCGQEAVALTKIGSDSGRVFVEGESWNAHSQTPIPEGAPVKIVHVDGLSLSVKPIQTKEPI
jgi:membrane-bound serine protease (ClpP class)